MTAQSHMNSTNKWGPDTHDIYGGATRVIEALERKADVRDSFSAIELGGDAGRAVLDQYYFARGENNMGTALRTIFSLQNVTNLSSTALPVVGLLAALGVDYEVFGSASKDMIQSNLPFNAFAFGSLIFASALGLAEKYENTSKKMFLYGALVIASVGASFIAANDDKFRAHFTDTIASAFTTGSDDEATRLQALRIQRQSIQDTIEAKTTRLETGGNGGVNMLADGSTGNDAEAQTLITEIQNLEGRRIAKDDEIAEAVPALEQATRKDWADFTGRILATSYIAAWLIAAQLLLSEIIRKSSDNFKNFRDALVTRSRQKKFVKDMESTDPEKRKAVIRSAVQAMLSRFSEVLSLSKPDPKHPDKHLKFAKLYEAKPYAQMLQTGMDMVSDATFPRGPSFWDGVRSMKLSFIWRAKDEPKPEMGADTEHHARQQRQDTKGPQEPSA